MSTWMNEEEQHLQLTLKNNNVAVLSPLTSSSLSSSYLPSDETEGICYFKQLPLEVQNLIIRTLPDASYLALIALVSKHFYRLAQNKYTWRHFIQTKWNITDFATVPLDFDWKLYYREKSAFMQPLKWQSVNSDPHPSTRQSHGSAALGSNLIIVGGHEIEGDNYQRKNDIWSFDTKSNEFHQLTPKGTIPAMSRHRMVTIGNIIYTFGGILQDKQKLNTVFKFDLSTLIWEEVQVTGEQPEPRCDPLLVAYGNKIIIHGGSIQDLVFQSDVYVFDTETNHWSKPDITDSPSPRIGCTGAVIGDSMFVYGGGDYDKESKKYTQLFNEIWVLDLINFRWSHIPTTGEIPNIYDFLTTFVIGNHMIIEGGWNSQPYAYDSVGRNWSQLTSEDGVINNNETSATLIGDAVYYSGGYHNSDQHRHLYKLDMSHLNFL